MIITGSALFVEPGSAQEVLDKLNSFPEVTFHVASDSRTELIVTLEVRDHADLERLGAELVDRIPEIIEVAHLYVNFEEEIEKIQAGQTDLASLIPESTD